MKSSHSLFVALTAVALLSLSVSAHAQAATRATPCDPATPINAACISYSAITVDNTRAPLTKPVSYIIEQRIGTNGLWSQVATGTDTNYYAKNLAPGTYYFRVSATCTPNCIPSLPSNVASKDSSDPPTQPASPIITIAVVISADHAPVYRIVSGNQRGELFGLVPIGRECSGPVVFRYRGASFRRVAVQANELWGTSDGRNLAAPCA